MTTIEIKLSGAQGTLPLFYRVAETPVAQRWVGYLERAIEEQAPIEEHVVNGQSVRGHFLGFPRADLNRDSLAARINDCVDLWNSHAPGSIPVRAVAGQGQAELNRLHKHFELCRGPINDPPAPFASAPAHIKRALEDFNYLIHEFENLIRSERCDEEQVVVSMEAVFLGNMTRYRLLDEDFEHFKTANVFGEMHAHYCEVGKEVLDVYADGDQVVGDDNIRPQQCISAAFDCYFGATWSGEYARRYRAKLEPWLRMRGYDPSDKYLSLGRIAVGTLIVDGGLEGLTQHQIVDRLSGFMNIEQVVIHRPATGGR